MAEFTKEQLIAEVHYNLEHCFCSEKTKRIMEIALAALTAGMEQEPIATLNSMTSENGGLPYGAIQFLRMPTGEELPGLLKLYAAPQLPQPALGDGRDHFEEWFKFHYGDENSIVKLHRANGGANYRDQYVDLAWIAWKDSRAAMLQGGEPVTKECRIPDDFDFDRFNDVVWLETVASNPHMHSLTASTIAMVALELNRKLADGNTPAIPEGYALVPVEPTAEMIEATFAGEMELQSVQHQIRNRERRAHYYRAMLAAALQQEVK